MQITRTVDILQHGDNEFTYIENWSDNPFLIKFTGTEQAVLEVKNELERRYKQYKKLVAEQIYGTVYRTSDIKGMVYQRK